MTAGVSDCGQKAKSRKALFGNQQCLLGFTDQVSIHFNSLDARINNPPVDSLDFKNVGDRDLSDSNNSTCEPNAAWVSMLQLPRRIKPRRIFQLFADILPVESKTWTSIGRDGACGAGRSGAGQSGAGRRGAGRSRAGRGEAGRPF